MKTALKWMLWLLATIGKLTAQYDPSFEQVLRDYINEDISSLDKTRRDQIVANWPGTRTMDGIRSIVQELLKPTGDERRSRTFQLLERSEVPRDQIVPYLLEGAEANRNHPELLGRYMFLFCEFPQDNRILSFLSPLLDNKEIPNRDRAPDPREERVNESPRRVCDGAHGTIIQILEKRGEMKPGDPGYGDPGGEATILKREHNIAQLKQRLIQSGYYAPANTNPPSVSPPPQGNSPSKRTKTGYPTTGLPRDGVNDPNPQTNGSDAQPSVRNTNWFLWVFVSIVTVSLMVLLIVKRSTTRSTRK